jgi:uncharacterized protein HemY
MRAGNLIMALGAFLLLGGALVRYFPGAFTWFGNLPGDVRIEGENTRVFIPITSMIIVSVVLSVLVRLVGVVLRDR